MSETELPLTAVQCAFFASFSAIALILKSTFLYNTKFSSGNSVAIAFLVFGLLLVINNAIEMLAYLVYPFNQAVIEHLEPIYFYSLYFGLPAMLNFSLALGAKNQKSITFMIYGAAVLMSIFHSLGYIVDGILFKGYTWIGDPAEFYYVFEMYAIFYGAVTSLVLLHTIRTESCSVMKSKNVIAFVGLLPFLLGSALIVFLMRLGVEVSSGIYIPIASVYLVFVCRFVTKEKLLDLSMSFSLLKKLILAFLESFSTNPGKLNERMSRIESVAIEIALYQAKGIQKDAAIRMGISEPTLSRKLSSIQKKNKGEIPTQ